MRLLLPFLGFILSILPECILVMLASGLARIAFLCASKRRQILLRNLSHVYPDWDNKQLHRFAIKNITRLIEMGMFSLASPFFSCKRIHRHFQAEGDWSDFLKNLKQHKTSQLLLIPHLTLTEALTYIPEVLHFETKGTEIGIIYRPFGSAALEKYIKDTRERFGIKLLSRKNGLTETANILKRKGCVGLLFDQFSGNSGALSTLCDRITSTTLLPEILLKYTDAKAYFLYTQRTGFWRAKFVLQPIHNKENDIVLTTNQILEEKLHNDLNFSENWLWVHNRWKRAPHKILNLNAKKSILDRSFHFYHWASLPKNFRIVVRMPNWLGDNVMALPLLRAIRNARPDAHIKVLVKRTFIPLLQSFHLIDSFEPLPERRGIPYFWKIRNLARWRPDLQIVLTNSARGDIESFLIGAPIRIGLSSQISKWRPLLTHTHKKHISKNDHLTSTWAECLSSFGLPKPVDKSPFFITSTEQPIRRRLAFIFGGISNPGKCWSTESWSRVAEFWLSKNPQHEVVLLGIKKDIPEGNKIQEGVSHALRQKIYNLVGKTTISEFLTQLTACDIVIGVDTGGMHLSNAIGRPTIWLFGPTNPLQTGPAFTSKSIVVQPNGCPKSGGKSMKELSVQQVIQAIDSISAS